MSDAPSEKLFAPTTIELMFVWFQRTAAVLSVFFGMSYWIRLIGYYNEPLWRFDLMPAPWQVCAVVLAALFPFAGAGLWMLASWGPVIWFICAAIEFVMHLGFPSIFGHRYGVLFLHGLTIAFYVFFRISLAIQERRARQES